MLSGRRLLAWGVTALAGYAACAFPEFEFEDDASSEASQGGGGGSATTTSGGGTGGCTLGAVGSCGEGMKCTVDPASGAIVCGMAGSRQIWDLCTTDADCTDGTWCDVPFSVCKPFCDNVDDCNFGATQGECVPLRDETGTQVPGTSKHCTSGCAPMTASPCVTPAVTCVLVAQTFDCAKSGGTTLFQDCTSSENCVPGMVCGDQLCRPWCTPPGELGENPECPDPYDWCSATDPQVHWQGAEYGFCI